MLTHHHWFSAGGGFVISEAISACGRVRLRGERSCADNARGTYPSALPSIACGRDEGLGAGIDVSLLMFFRTAFFECQGFSGSIE